MTDTAPSLIPVAGRLFQDTIDGYFPLRESLRQMMLRQGFASAWISLAHAPFMDLPGIAPGAPVPLRISPGSAGVIRRMALVARMAGDAIALQGTATWSWLMARPGLDPVFSPDYRLAEPVFLRGIGLFGGALETRGFGALSTAGTDSPLAVLRAPADPSGIDGLWLWGLGRAAPGITRSTGEGACFGATALPAAAISDGLDYLAVRPADPAVARAARALRDDL